MGLLDTAKNLVGAILDAAEGGRNWQERLKKGSITTPDGKKFDSWSFEDLDKSIENKTTEYQFADLPGSYVQNFGLGKTSFNLIIFFTGKNYDKDAKKFDKSIGKPGKCKIEHPRYGKIDAVILSAQRQDNEKTGAGQAIYTLALTETVDIKIPKKSDSKNKSLGKLGKLLKAIGDAFNKLNAIATNISNAVNTIGQFVDGVVSITENLVSSINELYSNFASLKTTILNNLDALVQTPDLLAAALSELVFLPSATTDTNDPDTIIAAYTQLYNTISFPTIQDNSQNGINQNLIAEFTANLVTAAIVNTYNNATYETAQQATNAAANIAAFIAQNQANIDAMQSVSAGSDLQFLYVPDPEVVNQLYSFSVLTAQFLVQQSFTAKKEFSKILQRDYTIIDLCYELYRSVDNTDIDFLINTNKLSGDELLIIPKGREIKYYV